MVGPAAKREAVAHLRTQFEMSERRATALVGADRTMIRYAARRPDDTVLRARLRDLAHQRHRFGYLSADRQLLAIAERRRLFVLLRRDGEGASRNRVYRLYRLEGLAVRKRKGRRRAVGTRAPLAVPLQPNARWSLDFVHDQLACGRRFRILNVVDDATRECLLAVADTSISGKRVARELTALVARRGRPCMRDCQDFCVWAGIKGKKETHYVPTQRALDTE
jgi:putative transposase